MAEFCLDVLIMLRVSCDCANHLSHSCSGALTSIVANPEMKWYLAVLTAVSAALTRWLCGSTNWMLVFWLMMYFLMALEHSLSKTCSLGARFRSCRYSYMSLNTAIMDSSLRFFIGRSKIALIL